MRLSEKGYIPETIGKWGYEFGVMDDAIAKISEERNIPIAVHFYSDVKKRDDERTIEMMSKSNEEFVSYIFDKFKIDEKYKEKALQMKLTDEEFDKIMSTYGEDNLKDAISSFNTTKEKELDQKRDEYYDKKEKEYKTVE